MRGELGRVIGTEIERMTAAPTPEQEAKLGELTRRVAALDQQLKALMPEAPAAAAGELNKQLAVAVQARDEFANSFPQLRVMADVPEPRPTHILVRGDYRSPGEQVSPGVPASLGTLPDGLKPNRLALARWLTQPQHPLTARVQVNRLWQMIFGVGLVKTSEEFGSQGERPSHPELLDWLAVEFVESGWNVKHMLKLIVTSATYRQSSKISPGLLELDPVSVLCDFRRAKPRDLHRPPAGDEHPAPGLRAQSQAHHFPVHVRRAIADRPVRSKAQAQRLERPANA